MKDAPGGAGEVRNNTVEEGNNGLEHSEPPVNEGRLDPGRGNYIFLVAGINYFDY